MSILHVLDVNVISSYGLISHESLSVDFFSFSLFRASCVQYIYCQIGYSKFVYKMLSKTVYFITTLTLNREMSYEKNVALYERNYIKENYLVRMNETICQSCALSSVDDPCVKDVIFRFNAF